MPHQLITQEDRLSSAEITDLEGRLKVEEKFNFLSTAISSEYPRESALLNFKLDLDSHLYKEQKVQNGLNIAVCATDEDVDRIEWYSFATNRDVLLFGNAKRGVQGNKEVLKAAFENYQRQIAQNKYSKLHDWGKPNPTLANFIKRDAMQDTVIKLFQATANELEKNFNDDYSYTLSEKNIKKIALALAKKD